ncbi:MAG: nucleoside triphosphate pyrophosphohydrolase [bacterium]|nr:nucleoside triphosphate pyrophosphohydrolase [bacterium]
MASRDEIAGRFLELVDIMARLRGEGGCPWDREQTHLTLKKYLIEEAYELLESIDDGDDAAMTEECGDVLLQVVFHAQLAAEEGRFDIHDVTASICDKLIRRHPHVFGDRDARDSSEVLRNWEADKRKEKPERTSILAGVPRGLPALMQAHEIQKKAARVGFDWERIDEVFDKVEEEWREFREARESMAPEKIAEELGDLLFAMVNVARYVEVNAEEALAKTNKKFIRRFQHIERHAARQEKKLEQMTLFEMDELWEEAKRLEREADVMEG